MKSQQPENNYLCLSKHTKSRLEQHVYVTLCNQHPPPPSSKGLCILPATKAPKSSIRALTFPPFRQDGRRLRAQAVREASLRARPPGVEAAPEAGQGGGGGREDVRLAAEEGKCAIERPGMCKCLGRLMDRRKRKKGTQRSGKILAGGISCGREICICLRAISVGGRFFRSMKCWNAMFLT